MKLQCWGGLAGDGSPSLASPEPPFRARGGGGLAGHALPTGFIPCHPFAQRSFLALTIVALLGGVPALGGEGGGKLIFEEDHIQTNYDEAADEWMIGFNPSHSATYPIHPADEFILLVGPSSKMTVPPLNPSFEFLGEEGDDVWVTNLFGFAQFAIERDVFTGPPDPPGVIAQSLVEFDGPNYYFAYTLESGNANLVFDTRAEEPSYGSLKGLRAGGHFHTNWAFRARGIYFLTLQASGTLKAGGVETFSDPTTFTVLVDPLPVHWWIVEHFEDRANQPEAALGADPDGDGVVNLVEYAFGLDPLSPGRDGLPRVERREDEGEEWLWISCRQPEGREDIRYSVEGSNGPGGGWEPIDLESTEIQWSVDPDGTPVVSVRDIVPIGAGEGRRFLRMTVEWLEE